MKATHVFPNPKSQLPNSLPGIAALPTVMIIAMVILIAGVGIAGSSFVETLVAASDYDSKGALYAAEAGAQDALKRLGRVKTCNEGGSPACSSYTLAFGKATVTVTVTGTNPKTVRSQGVLGNTKRTIELGVSFDANDEMAYSTWQEVTN